MLVHVVESCPAVHSRFVPKPKADATATSPYLSPSTISLEEIITDDASVLPFGITCINITDMLAKFLLFSKAVDKMDALLSAKPFWKMFVDPNAMLVLQEISLDLLCDVCVEIGRERRIGKLAAEGGREDGKKDSLGGMPGTQDGKVRTNAIFTRDSSVESGHFEISETLFTLRSHSYYTMISFAQSPRSTTMS